MDSSGGRYDSGSSEAVTHGTARYAIGELCDAFGVTARALRFYEDEQLIAPERRGTSRFYSDRDRARLSWILRGKRSGSASTKSAKCSTSTTSATTARPSGA